MKGKHKIKSVSMDFIVQLPKSNDGHDENIAHDSQLRALQLPISWSSQKAPAFLPESFHLSESTRLYLVFALIPPLHPISLSEEKKVGDHEKSSILLFILYLPAKS